jgi:hypothetical protein
LVEKLTPEKSIKQTSFVEASTSKPKVRCENPKEVIPKIKIEISSSNTPNYLNKGVSSIHVVVNFLPTHPRQKKRFQFSETLKSILYTPISLLSVPLFTHLVSLRKQVHVFLSLLF